MKAVSVDIHFILNTHGDCNNVFWCCGFCSIVWKTPAKQLLFTVNMFIYTSHFHNVRENKQWQDMKCFLFWTHNLWKPVKIMFSNLLRIRLQIHKYKTYFISFIRIHVTLRKSLNILPFSALTLDQPPPK